MYEWLVIPFVFFVWMIARLLTGDAIFVPLPSNTVRKMLKLAKVKKTDTLYDIGSGDGRVLLIAAKEFGCKSVGIEKNKILLWLTKKKILKNNLQKKIKLIEGDFFNKKFSNASVVILYLTQKMNDKIESKLKKELKKGTRIVSANHTFNTLKEVKTIKTGHFYSRLYIV